MRYSSDNTAGLAGLFALSRDAVLFVRGGTVVFGNAAAAQLFGREVRGEAVSALLPELDGALPEGVTAVTLQGAVRTVTIVEHDALRIVTILRESADASADNAPLVHALRSNVFALRVALDQLAAQHPDEERLRTAYHSFYCLQHLVGELADASALSRGELALRFEALDLSALVRELADSAAFFTRGSGVRILCRVEPGDYPLRGDRDRLEQLVLILLNNSLRHTPAGGEIRLTLSRTARQYILAVDDDGEGMDGAALAGAFTPRTDAGPLSAAGGAGLGLFLAYGLSRCHGGTIVLRSEPGGGTKARVSLPIDPGVRLGDAAPAPDRGPERIWTELSDVLPAEAYDRKYRE